MRFFELFIIAVGLSMDAFAVSVCKGLSVPAVKPKHMLLCGGWFGAFQALMPFIGFLLGTQFEHFITSVDHWIAFVLLALIGFNMLRESFKGGGDEASAEANASFDCKSMLTLAVATSIDALAVGITFAFLRVDIVPAVLTIGVATFLISALGVKIGSVFGTKYQTAAERFGGIVLILIGLKILLEHLGILPF